MGGGGGGGGDNGDANRRAIEQQQADFVRQQAEWVAQKEAADRARIAQDLAFERDKQQTTAQQQAQTASMQQAQGASQQLTGSGSAPASLLQQPGRIDAGIRAGLPNFTALAARYKQPIGNAPQPGGANSNVNQGQTNQISSRPGAVSFGGTN